MTDEVRSLMQYQRKCYFNDEPLANMKTYSVGKCMMNCKADIALNLCKCKPYFYHLYPGKNCDPEGYMCLKVMYFPKDFIKRCKCSKTCTDYTFSRDSIKVMKWKKQTDASIMQKSSIRYKIISSKIKIRREVVFKFEDMLVSFGGAAALFIGLSILDLFKLLYGKLLKIHKLIHLITKRKPKTMPKTMKYVDRKTVSVTPFAVDGRIGNTKLTLKGDLKFSDNFKLKK